MEIRYQISDEFPPIIIYQMGKVGSKTIKYSLHKSSLKNFIGHAHNLNKNAAHGEEARITRELIDHFFGRVKFKIITLVRDPIAQIISEFFTNYQNYLPHIIHSKPDEAFNEVIEYLLDYFTQIDVINNRFVNWFDGHIKNVFLFDVYSQPFNYLKGYSIYSTKNIDILILKLEDLNNCYKEAFYQFLNIENFTLYSHNLGADKWYSDLYQNILNLIRIPEKNLDQIYMIKYCKHFYSEKELLAFKTKWNK